MAIKVKNIPFLINNYKSPITVGGITYPSVEHAYQAAKYPQAEIKRAIANSNNPKNKNEIKRLLGYEPVEDANFDRIRVMNALLQKKFENPELGELLAKTGNDTIEMDTGTDWDDIIPDILMDIREDKQVIFGIPSTPAEEEEEAAEEPALTKILNDGVDITSEIQEFYDAAIDLSKYVSAEDYDVDFICKHFPMVDRSVIVQAVEALKKFIEAKKALNDAIEEFSDDEDDSDPPIYTN